MIYVIGSSGILANKIKDKLDKKKIISVSTKRIKGHIKTNMFKKNKVEQWILKINEDDIVFLLSSFGNMEFHENNKLKIKNYIKFLDKNFFKNINKKTKVIFFSSDMIFDGKENLYTTQRNCKPLNEYGKAKLKIENLIRKRFHNYLILRIPKIFSKKRKDKIFPYNHIKDLKKNNIFLISDNKYHYIDIEFLVKILFKKEMYKITSGTFNLPYGKTISRYNFLLNFMKKQRIKFNYNKVKKISYINSKIKIPKILKMKKNII